MTEPTSPDPAALGADPRSIRVLLVEDSPDDAVLVERALRRHGLLPTVVRVERLERVREKLGGSSFDLVISDYRLPGFTGLEVLELVRELDPDLPAILVSGTISDELAVAAMRRGAQDYVMKDNLVRLGPAVVRELGDAEIRRERRRLDASYRALVEHSVLGLAIVRRRRVELVNPALAAIFGLPRTRLEGLDLEAFEELFEAGDRDVISSWCRDRGTATVDGEVRMLRIASAIRPRRWVEASARPVELDGGGAVQLELLDVTRRVQRTRELEAVVSLAAHLRRADRRPELVAALLDESMELLGADAAALASADQGEVRFELARGAWAGEVEGTVPEGAGLTWEVLETAAPFVGDAVAVGDRLAVPEIARRTRFLAGMPLIVDREPLGVLWIGRDRPVDADDLRVLGAIADMAASALRRLRLHEVTNLQLRRLHALRMVDLAITTSSCLDEVFDVVMEQVEAELGVDGARILVWRSDTGALEVASARGASLGAVDRPDVGVDLSREILEGGRLLEVGLDEDSGSVDGQRAWLVRAGMRVAAGVPLVAGGRARGVLEVASRRELGPGTEWRGFLETLAWQVGIAIDNAGLLDDLRRSKDELAAAYESTLEGWARALELRDQETEGHTRRVTDLTLRLAGAFGCSGPELDHIRRGAMLHDIGKMAIPDSILLKPGPLDDAEWRIMRRHTDHARDMLSSIEHLEPAIVIPYGHHERWDGTGYPLGLAGEEIPLPARLFAVVDVWDALRSDRPYRSSWPEEKVRAYLREHSGRHFDPKVVEVFLTLV